MIKPAICGVSEEFKQKVTQLKWIAYSPTNYDPDQRDYPSEDSIRADLQVLYDYGFRAIATYGANGTLAEIPRIAAELGFSGMIMGIWDIEDREEMMNAVFAAQYVDGYCVGNEGLNCKYDLETLMKAIRDIKQTTKRPATTSEQINDYGNDRIFAIGDWVFPNIHPFLNEVKEPKKASRWVLKHYQVLQKHIEPDRVILFKEVGFPTRGMSGASEQNQMIFFLNMEKLEIPFVYFEAFDQKWKTQPACEPYWGMFTKERKPKKYAASFLE